MPDLTRTQADALPVLEWLLSDDQADRRTGRSFVVALAYAQYACRRLHQWILVRDISPLPGEGTHDLLILEYIQSIFEAAVEETSARSTHDDFHVDVDYDQTPGRIGFRVQSLGARVRDRIFSVNSRPGFFGTRARAISRMRGRRALDLDVQPVPNRIVTGSELYELLEQDVDAIEAAALSEAELEPIVHLEGSDTQRVINFVLRRPGHSASEIAKHLKLRPGSVADILARAVRRNELKRVGGGGPRGGSVYYPVNVKAKAKSSKRTSVWDRLKTNPFATAHSSQRRR